MANNLVLKILYAAALFEMGGQRQEMETSFGSMRLAIFLAIFMVYLVMASQFESLLHPLVILFSMPFGLIGLLATLYLFAVSISIVVLIGAILLAGIVVNNAIILVDHINLRRRDGLELSDAILRGAAERVRPILVTSITTIGGLLPLILVTSSEVSSRSSQDIWSNLALATIGGLSAATVLTLTVIPVLYLLAERARGGGRRIGAQIAQIWRSLPD